MADQFLNAEATVKKLNTAFVEHATVINKAGDSLERLEKLYIKLPSEALKSVKSLGTEKQKLATSTKQLNEAEKETLRLAKQIVTLKQKTSRATQQQNKELQNLRVTQQQQNRQAKEEAILNNSLVGAYQKLNLRRTQASKALRDLIASGNASNAQIQRAQMEFNKLDGRIRKADMAVRDHTKNVGNYRSALGGLGGTLRSLAGAFGFTSAVFIFANMMRDAVKRVRDFDKSMANLSGILGTSRENLKGLEQAIISVAGSSIKTSNEVADLATALITLGKTESEVRKLLKPTNDLSIALQATSEDAGKLLVGTLNAFGKSADEGLHFGNVIARMRTRSALDFQQIADSMGFLAPAANAAGMSIEQAGAMVGILADNNIKGQRAGRLMSSSLLRLAKDGLTLEDALGKLNKAQSEGATRLELLALSAELFDVQAAPLGLILAANTDRLKDFSSELENSAGALDELTEAQLKSLDAQLKILDSTWESLILKIENGEGVLGKFASWWIKNVTNALGSLNLMVDENLGFFDKWRVGLNGMTDNVLPFLQVLNGGKPFFNDFVNNLRDSKISMEELSDATQTQREEFTKMHGSLAPLTKEMQDLTDASRDYYALVRGNQGENEAQINTIASLRQQISDLNTAIDESITTDIKGIRTKQDKIKALQAELDLILGTTNATIAKKKAVESILPALQAYIDRLKAIRDEVQKQNTTHLKSASEEHINAGTAALVRYQIQTGRTTESVIYLGASVQELQDIFGSLNGSAFNIDFANIGTIFSEIQNGFQNSGEAAEAFGALAIDVFGEITRSQNLNLQNQIKNLELQKNVEIEFAGDSAVARGQIEERFNREKLRLQREQAKNSKAMAILEAVVGTSVAVIKALAVGPPQGFLLAALAGALGAAQIATIASAPLPQFKDGVRNFDGGQAIVGDGGKREPITDKSGKLIGVSPAKSTLVDLPKGANVYSSEGEFYREMNGLLGSNNIIPIQSDAQGLTEIEVYRAMKKAIGDKPSETIILDKNGFTTSMVKGATRVNNLNNRVTVKGKNV